MLTRRKFLAACVATPALLSPMMARAADEERKRPAKILSPESDSEVDRFEDLGGEITQKGGWPVILVRPLIEDEPWYVQPPVMAVDDGEFTTRVYFGDQKSAPGTRFRIVILVARSRLEAAKFKEGTPFRAIPPGLGRSNWITVTLKRPAEKEKETPKKEKVPKKRKQEKGKSKKQEKEPEKDKKEPEQDKEAE